MGREKPTEAVLEETRDLDQRSVEDIVAAIHAEDYNALDAVGKVLSQVVQAVDVLTCVLAGGGRWFNIGAGTSGRMGALDAAEIPPTFGLPAGRMQAVVAGGPRALGRAIEGAEDNCEAGAWELRKRGLASGDAVLAISASGQTPFTLGSLEAAHAVGARTIAITCDPAAPLADAAEIAIVPAVGPEVIAGSTRMKGGLAQKAVLHTISTTVMVKLGYVSGNLMTHLVPSSEKLRRRAEWIVMELSGVSRDEAVRILEETGGDPAQAVARALRRS
jgi:N-acetylmuramic acid 6-phosphate etherase